MTSQLNRLSLTLSATALMFVAGCGDGGSSSPPVVATTAVKTTVVDGAIKNAVVCVDKNGNGQCDAGEVQGKTAADGSVTLTVPNDDVGKYPLVAVVGTDAIDADNGPVTVAYTLSAPADQSAVVSPLTTLVQQTVAGTGATTAAAAAAVQATTGITASLFDDFTKVPAPTDGSISAATVARMVVVTTQQQAAAISIANGSTAIDGTTITQAELDRAVQKKLLELLPALVAAISSNPALLDPKTPAADAQAALTAAATTVVANSGLTPASVATVVAVNNQDVPTTPPAATPPSSFVTLARINFNSATSYMLRLLTGSAAQNTPDSNNKIRYVDRRVQAVNGNVAKWGFNGSPPRNADVHWNGSAWVNCPINFESVQTVRDASGNSIYDSCDKNEIGNSKRATFDVGGRKMTEVYAQILAAGYTNLTIADAPTMLGSQTFPTGSSLYYQTITPSATAINYIPGSDNMLNQYSAAVSAGGDASAQPSGVACNSNLATTRSTTLEGVIAAMTGTPCVYGQGSFTYNGVKYLSEVPNEWWGNSTLNIGTIGTAPLNSGTAPGYYSGNTKIRVAFQGTGANPVTYYACKERFTDGSPRKCTAIGTGSYAIATLGDARVLNFGNPPAQAAALTYDRVFVERGGKVYFGYKNKPVVSPQARLNTIATAALLAQLGLTPEDPSVPLTLTAASYQGTWDFSDAAVATDLGGPTLFINANGSVSCQDRSDGSFFACTLNFTDLASGAFSLVFRESVTILGTLGFISGTASGTFHDPSNVPTDGKFVAQRR